MLRELGYRAEYSCVRNWREQALQGTRSAASGGVLQQDEVIFFGDLNYRIDQVADEAVTEMIETGQLEQVWSGA